MTRKVKTAGDDQEGLATKKRPTEKPKRKTKFYTRDSHSRTAPPNIPNTLKNRNSFRAPSRRKPRIQILVLNRKEAGRVESVRNKISL